MGGGCAGKRCSQTPIGIGQHLPALHTPLAALQSASALQLLPHAHTGHVPPPQSTSVSLAFFTPSLQLGVEQVFALESQTPLVQSPPEEQPRPSPHFAGHEPPQSLSVSLPFFCPSLQVAVEQSFADGSHTRLEQSAPEAHFCPSPHCWHEPPQSTSVSLPF